MRTAAVVPEPLYGYAVRGTSLSRSYRPDRQEKNNAFLASCLNYCRENGLPEAVAVGLTVRYHAFTVATLKQIRAAALPKAEKRRALRAVFEDPFLHTTLGETVLAKEKRTLRLFYTLIRRRRYRAAALLLRLKPS